MKSFGSIFTICFLTGTLTVAPGQSIAAGVVQRGVAPARAAPRANNAIRMATTQTANTTDIIETVDTTIVEPEITTDVVAENTNVVEDKSAKFDSILTGVDTNTTDSSANARAQMIMDQRAALDAANTQSTSRKTAADALSSGKNSCDNDLRNCMKQKCDNDFSKCAGDGDTDWGNKLNTCRANSKCSGEEFTSFATEIKADRDYNSLMSDYTKTINCGNNYNSCIVAQCGTNFSKCLSKSVADAAISKCANVANGCQGVDGGLANRIQQVFGTLRSNANAQVPVDEKRLYELRDKMTDQCNSVGAMFDNRSLDCVFTVSLFGGDNTKTPMASKKLYAGDSFDCDDNWFGIDMTTYKENAYRLTRSKTAASSAMLGAGLGVAAGAISSGAISRAIDTQKAEKALEAAKETSVEKSDNSSDSSKNIMSQDKLSTSVSDENKSGSKTGIETNRNDVLKRNSEVAKNNGEVFQKMENADAKFKEAQKTGDQSKIEQAQKERQDAGRGLQKMESIQTKVTSPSAEKLDMSKISSRTK